MNLNQRQLSTLLTHLTKALTDESRIHNALVQDLKWCGGYWTQQFLTADGEGYKFAMARYPHSSLEIDGRPNYLFHESLARDVTVAGLLNVKERVETEYVGYWDSPAGQEKPPYPPSIKKTFDGR